MKKKNFTYIDLFAGCGGLSLGLHNADWKGIFAIEKSKDAFQTLKYNLIDKKHFFKWPKWLEITNLDINDVLIKHYERLKKFFNKVDLIAGGPPCQGFSSAGKRNEDDVRNGLINSYLKFVELINPKIIFFENVKGFTLKYHKNKSQGLIYADYVTKALTDLNYQVFGKLIDFSNFGIPQKRTRFILVGIRNDIVQKKNINAKLFFDFLFNNKKRFILEKNLPQNPKLKHAISDLLRSNGTVETPDRKGYVSGVYSALKSKYQKYFRTSVVGNIPDSHSFANHSPTIKKRFEFLLKTPKTNKSISKELREKFNLSKHTIIPLSSNEKTPTITTLPDDFIHYCEPRILTVREYARIQSFPDWYEFKGKYTTGGKKRTMEAPRYTQIGNAIPPLFSEQCGIILKELI